MGNATSMTRNQNDDDAFRRKRLKMLDNRGVTPWSELNHDVLLLVMMKLEVVDFVSFSGVCKSRRSLALSNRKRFMESRQPISIFMHTKGNEKEPYYYLRNYEGKDFKTHIPHLEGRCCAGFTCGYVILFGRETKDFWLVNPITTYELHFPNFTYFPYMDMEHCYDLTSQLKAILVFSPLINGWVFIMCIKYTDIWFCTAGKGAWNHILCDSFIYDLHVFKGKIYTINKGYRVYEIRLNPEPKLTLLEIKNFEKPQFLFLEFVNSSENLYVMSYASRYMFEFQELDFGEMKWIMPKKTLEKYAFFLSRFSRSVVISPEPCRSQYERDAYFLTKNPKYRFFPTWMWYFPHESMNVNLIDE